jgi:hypothetical protein
MSRVGWIVLIAVELCAVAAALWWRFGEEERAQPANAGDSTRSLPAPAASDVAPVERQGTAPTQSQDAPPPVEAEDYAARLRAASDYLEFAQALLPAARAGDYAAQFNIFRALDYCAREYRAFFGRGPVWRTLDDAMRRAATRWPYDSEMVRKVYSQCHALVESGAKEFGERDEWLRMASDGGYPLAQVTYAQNQWRAMSGPDDDATLEARRRLVGKAIRSRDPAVVSAVADVILEPEGQGYEWDHLAWRLAACQRGFDCSPQSDFVKWSCYFDASCQPYETAYDLIRRATGNDFPDVEARARWINEKIDGGDWEALGF